MTVRVPSGCACTVSRCARTLIVSRLLLVLRPYLGVLREERSRSPRGATVGARPHRVNATFRRPTSGLTQVATADPASMADGATVSSPSVVRSSRISGPGCQAASERPLFVLWMSVDTGITAKPRGRHGAGSRPARSYARHYSTESAGLFLVWLFSWNMVNPAKRVMTAERPCAPHSATAPYALAHWPDRSTRTHRERASTRHRSLMKRIR